MSQQTLLMYAAVGVAILVAINVAMRVLRAVIRIAVVAAVAGVVSQARADASSVRVSQTCQGGRRLVVVRYREPGFPFGLGRPETLTVDATGGCAAVP